MHSTATFCNVKGIFSSTWYIVKLLSHGLLPLYLFRYMGNFRTLLYRAPEATLAPLTVYAISICEHTNVTISWLYLPCNKYWHVPVERLGFGMSETSKGLLICVGQWRLSLCPVMVLSTRVTSLYSILTHDPWNEPPWCVFLPTEMKGLLTSIRGLYLRFEIYHS